MRLRLLFTGSLIVLLAACGSGDGGTRPTITATLPPDASVVRPTRPPETDPGTSPVETPPPEETPEPEELPDSTAVPAPETVPASSVAPGEDGEGTVWWPWILLIIAVIGLIVALVRRRRPSPSWQLRATTLLDEIEQLTSHLAVVTPDGLRAVAQSDAMALATLRATLRDLVASAPDASRQTTLNGLTAPLATLHGAVDAAAMSADPTTAPTSISQVAMQLHTAAASARADLAVQP